MAKISNKFLDQVPANTIKGNNTGSTANITDLTIPQVQTMLGITASVTGDIGQTSFTAADNQAAAADVTGFLFSNASVRSFDALISIVRSSTYEVIRIQGIQKAASWEISQSYTGDVTGITFSITNAGQVQYTSTSTGSTATIKFRAIVTSV